MAKDENGLICDVSTAYLNSHTDQELLEICKSRAFDMNARVDAAAIVLERWFPKVNPK